MRTGILTLCIFLFSCSGYSQKAIFNEYDLNNGIIDSYVPNYAVTLNNKMYFTAKTASAGQELWITDGTITGTSMVKDMAAGAADGFPEWLTVYNNNVFFSANDNINGTEVWVSDGTSSGTHMLKNINAGYQSSYPSNFIEYNGKLYFSADEGNNGRMSLWVTDGTDQGTKLVKDFDNSGSMLNWDAQCCISGGKLFFLATDNVHGTELWATDGTASGTQIVKDINLGLAPGGVAKLLTFNGNLYFMAETVASGRELWVSDGTGNGTHLFKDIYPGGRSSSLSSFYETRVEMNGNLYFSADDGINGPELWKTDGTDAGTVLVKDINPGSQGSTPSGMYVLNNKLYFSATTAAAGTELWVTDGTDAGTALLADIIPGTESAKPLNLTGFENKLFFWARADKINQQLFYTNGNIGDLHPIQPWALPANLRNLDNSGFCALNSSLFFASTYNTDGRKLWSVTFDYESDNIAKNSIATYSTYPNPNNGNFTLNIPGFNGNTWTNLTIEDVMGRQVYTQNITKQVTAISLHDVPAGVYITRLLQDGETHTAKIVIR